MSPVGIERAVVVGSSGSGKSTTARELARRLDGDHIELDAIVHGPGWVQRPRDVVRERVLERMQAPRWVVDGNYRSLVQDLVLARVDTVVWLDLPRRVVLPALIGRTLRRGLLREELWNGNRERVLQILDPRPEHNVVMWSATRFASLRARYAALAASTPRPELRVVRLRSRSEVAHWLGGIGEAAP